MSDSDQSLSRRRPALIALIPLILGILLSLVSKIPYYYPLIPSLMLLVCVIVFHLKRNTRLAAISIVLSMLFLGWYLSAISRGPFPPNHISNIAGEGFRTEMAGSVVEEPDIRPDKMYLTLETDSLKTGGNWIPILGHIRVRIISNSLNIRHDDYLNIPCYLYKPSGATNPMGFDYAAYLATKEIFAEAYVSNPAGIEVTKRGNSILSSGIGPLRDKLVAISKKYLKVEQASMLTGFMLGERREMPDEYQRLFKDTGTMHLMAVSGSNVGMVLLIFGFILSLLHLPRSAKAIILLFVVAAFALLTRLEPSVIRASIMAAVGIVAYGWMRKPDLINLLAFSGILMLLWRPMQLFDVGFQLSFAATFGIIYALPKMAEVTSVFDRPGLYWLRWAVLAFLGTMAAQIAVLPLMAHYFQSLPVLGGMANIPVIFLASIAMILGVALFVFSAFGGWLPALIAAMLGGVLDITVIILRFFSSLPLAKISSASFGWAAIILFWASAYLIFEAVASRRITRRALIFSLVCLNFFIWPRAFGKQSDWRVEFLDLRRNHCWIFSAVGRPTIACFDSYEPGGDAESVVIPRIFNQHAGKLDYLLTITPDSPEIDQVASEFGASVITFGGEEDSSGRIAGWFDTLFQDNTNCNLSETWIKVLWDQSDNTNAGASAYPAIEIDVDGGALIFAGWSGMKIGGDIFNSDIGFVELPWSQYARSRSVEIIARCNPCYAIFSPDRYSTAAPEKREKLTHTFDKTISTSLCGAFAINGRDCAFELETMKPRK